MTKCEKGQSSHVRDINHMCTFCICQSNVSIRACLLLLTSIVSKDMSPVSQTVTLLIAFSLHFINTWPARSQGLRGKMQAPICELTCELYVKWIKEIWKEEGNSLLACFSFIMFCTRHKCLQLKWKNLSGWCIPDLLCLTIVELIIGLPSEAFTGSFPLKDTEPAATPPPCLLTKPSAS